ncbi:MAG TPA: hypothetical protein VF665_21325 [Longimicrobium sp.]|jgi:hypothetical protein|uniref:hypothetical protein n=1 Tax=Longimicrobium sp. TaxID=2029185 RepID=UPI002ED9FC69
MDAAAAVGVLIAISLAGERIVAIVKTLAPGWFKEPPVQPGTDKPSDTADRGRRMRVQTVAFASCMLAAMSLDAGFSPMGHVDIGGLQLPVVLVALLSMGGSAFWSQVLGITSVLKDLKTGQLASLRAESQPAKAPGATPDKVQVPGEIIRA